MQRHFKYPCLLIEWERTTTFAYKDPDHRRNISASSIHAKLVLLVQSIAILEFCGCETPMRQQRFFLSSKPTGAGRHEGAIIAGDIGEGACKNADWRQR